MLALVPLRGVAAMTIGLCELSDKAAAAQIVAEHGHNSSHDHAPCNLCAEHCGSAVFAVPEIVSPLAVTAGLQPAAPLHLLLPGLAPEELDRPPIAL